ncbi:MAG: hypothetical protein KJP00_04670 [Bacteroidia bacterium]|nr:hypothetical protein [Bacteroidia bacterium]
MQVNPDMENNQLYQSVIEGYRNLIKERYQYDLLIKQYDVPKTFTEDKFNKLEHYFLNYIYPSIDKRKELDDAFESLDGHIKNPKYLLSVLVDSFGILFKYGTSLPKILRTGIKALHSFRNASQFEEELVQEAVRSGLKTPLDTADIRALVGGLSRPKVNKFIDESLALFETLHDRRLVTQVIDIVDNIIIKMKKKSHIYPREELRGLELGREIIVIGNRLFDQLEPREQQLLFELVVRIERDALDDMFNQASRKPHSPGL